MVYSSITRDIKGSRSAHISQLQREREQEQKSPESTAKIQKRVLVIFNSHHQHRKTLPEMSPLQIIAASALLLACVYLPLGTPMPVTARVIRRTGTEAINAKVEIDNYLKDTYGNKHLNMSATCSSLQDRIVLPSLQNGPGVIKIWGPRRFGDPPSPILRRNGDPRVKMGTPTHTVVGKGRSLSNLSQEERISATDE